MRLNWYNICENMRFREVAHENDNDNSEEEYGFDIWDNDVIPNPLLDLDAEKVESVSFNFIST